MRKNYIYCELDDIYDAAQEEGLSIIRIEQEIQKALSINVFQTRNQYLISNLI